MQREVDALLHEAYPPSGAGCAPLPRTTPRAAEEMGPPIASAVLVQEYWIGLMFLRVAGWIIIAGGAIFVVVAGLFFLKPFAMGSHVAARRYGPLPCSGPNGHARFEWNRVTEVEVKDRCIVLRDDGDRKLVTIPLEELPYPTLFVALVRAIIAHARKRFA